MGTPEGCGGTTQADPRESYKYVPCEIRRCLRCYRPDSGLWASMGETTLIHLSRMIALERKLDILANNVANANSAGFRSRELSFREYLKPEKKIDENGNKERP